MPRLFVLAVLALAAPVAGCARPAPAHPAPAASHSPVDVAIVSDQAEAALAILRDRAAGVSPSEVAWRRHFASEGYRRLRMRETAMGRLFSDSSFAEFLSSDTLLRRADALERALPTFAGADIAAAASRALAYLPTGARISARLYPVIKPRTNSFIFEFDDGRAIFLYVDPARTRAQVENTLVHELHHIGYATVCGLPADTSALSERTVRALRWTYAFGEGLAMLAAAGGPATHPHAVSDTTDRQRWDRDVASVDSAFAALERFFLDVLEGRIATADSAQRAAMTFYGVQGPWYTVGWTMASAVERAFGHARLIDAMCDPRRLLRTHNAAAAALAASRGERVPTWSVALLDRLDGR